MNLSDTGKSRVNGYLFVLERSLKTFLPGDVARDAVREIESHMCERIAAMDGTPTEHDALEKILAELGPPLRVAQAYAAERIIDEAVTTGRLIPIARAIWQVAATTLMGIARRHGSVQRLCCRDRIPGCRCNEADLSQQRRSASREWHSAVLRSAVPHAARRNRVRRLLDHPGIDRLWNRRAGRDPSRGSKISDPLARARETASHCSALGDRDE